MLGILIAAGMGKRLKSFTQQMPKCLLPVNAQGRTLLDQTLDNFWSVGCTQCLVITGHAHTAFDALNLPSTVDFIHNPGYADNNILHSLMSAKDFFDRPLIISYSDIWVEPGIYQQLLATDADAVLAVDEHWQDYYTGRDQHPIEQAEKVVYTLHQQKTASHPSLPEASLPEVVALGKVLPKAATQPNTALGEFLGLMKLSAAAARQFRQDFLTLDQCLSQQAPFQQAASWRQAYLTDFIQHQIDSGRRYVPALVSKGWVELDTVQDYQRLPLLAKSQRLESLYQPQSLAVDEPCPPAKRM